MTDTEKLAALRALVREFLDEISGIPMRAIDCDQDAVDDLWRKLAKAAKEPKPGMRKPRAGM